MLWGGNRLIGSYWYLSMTGRHQTNVAGRALKQIEFETLQPGPAVPLPSAHISTCRKAVLSLAWISQSLRTEKASIQPMSWARSSPNPVLSESRCRGTRVCHNTLPGSQKLAIGLFYPLALLGLWAELSFCLAGPGCKVVVKSEHKKKFFGDFVSSQSVGHPSFPTSLQHQAHSLLTCCSPFTLHAFSPTPSK